MSDTAKIFPFSATITNDTAVANAWESQSPAVDTYYAVEPGGRAVVVHAKTAAALATAARLLLGSDRSAMEPAPAKSIAMPVAELHEQIKATLLRNLGMLTAADTVDVFTVKVDGTTTETKAVRVCDVEEMLHACAANIAQALAGRVLR